MDGWLERIHGCLIADRNEADVVDNGEVDGLPLLECRGAIAHFATVCLDFRFVVWLKR